MELRDATLMMLTESAGHPRLEQVARRAFEALADTGEVRYDILDELISEASGSGVLRELRHKYSPVAFEALITPILSEIGRRKPIQSDRRPPAPGSADDPLTAPAWPA